MESFMAITIHALSKDFDMINMTLEVDPLRGRHTGQFIAQRMKDSFDNWGMQKDNLVMMLRDNASNVKKLAMTWESKVLAVLATLFISLLDLYSYRKTVQQMKMKICWMTLWTMMTKNLQMYWIILQMSSIKKM